eukprot:5035705-Pyramimonas_sp.AAC.1
MFPAECSPNVPRMFPKTLRVSINASQMDGERLATALAILEPKQVAKLLNNLEPVSAAAVYTALDANHAVKALEQTDSRHCAEVLANNQLCKYILSRPYTTRVDLTHPQYALPTHTE